MYFAGKRLAGITETGTVEPVVQDRLGSDHSGGTKYFPYGEQPVTTQQNRYKFATYYRDATTALDYANQRYYGRTIGRFLTTDPFGGSADPKNPQSWNRYSYVEGDPVNANDPSGLFIEVPGPYQPPPFVPFSPAYEVITVP